MSNPSQKPVKWMFQTVLETIKQVTNLLEWYYPLVYKMCAYRKKKSGSVEVEILTVVSVYLGFQVIFTFILWTDIFAISVFYFYNQKTSISSLHFEQRRNYLIYSGPQCLTPDLSGSFYHKEMPGALDKGINFRRTAIKCAPGKNGRLTYKQQRWMEIFSARRDVGDWRVGGGGRGILVNGVWKVGPILRYVSTSN